MNNFTPEDLLQYHYGEMEGEQKALLENTLRQDWALREKLAVIREAFVRLDKSFYSPSERSVNTIMAYAAAACSITTSTG